MVETSTITTLLQLVALALPAIAITIQIMTDFGDRTAYQRVLSQKPGKAHNLEMKDVANLRNPQLQTDIRLVSLSAIFFGLTGFTTIIHLMSSYISSEFGIGFASIAESILYLLALFFVFAAFLSFLMAIYWMQLTPEKQEQSNLVENALRFR